MFKFHNLERIRTENRPPLFLNALEIEPHIIGQPHIAGEQARNTSLRALEKRRPPTGAFRLMAELSVSAITRPWSGEARSFAAARPDRKRSWLPSYCPARS